MTGLCNFFLRNAILATFTQNVKRNKKIYFSLYINIVKLEYKFSKNSSDKDATILVFNFLIWLKAYVGMTFSRANNMIGNFLTFASSSLFNQLNSFSLSIWHSLIVCFKLPNWLYQEFYVIWDTIKYISSFNSHFVKSQNRFDTIFYSWGLLEESYIDLWIKIVSGKLDGNSSSTNITKLSYIICGETFLSHSVSKA